jgi:drug/metabolite transporter (DMT)-like permease
MKPKVQSYFYLSLCILLWASIPVTSKKVLVELSNLQMLFYSSVLSAAAIGVIAVVQGKISTMKRYRWSDYRELSILGFLGAFLYYVLLYGAFARTTAAEGFILAYTWPILVSILAVILLGEKLTGLKVLAIGISFVGVVVIVTQGRIFTVNFTSLSGDMLALAGALVFALFSVLGKRKNFDQVVGAFVYFVVAFICVTATVLLFSEVKLPSASIWPWLIYNGLFVNGVTYIFWFKALEHGDTFVVSNALYLTPFLSLIYVYYFLNEPIHASSVVGLVIIVAGILLQSLASWTVRARLFQEKSGRP